MMLTDPVKDFFVKAVKQAKYNRMEELNKLEADIIMTEGVFLELRDKNLPPEQLTAFENRIGDLKKILKNKKQEL